VRPDPLPTIAIEAAALGRAVLASDAGGLPDIVEDGGTGPLVPPGDVAAWRAALEALDAQNLTDQGRRAVHRFESLFTQGAFAARFAQAFDAGMGLAPPRHDNEGVR
jgi:glycosyltransferase involved in cell wall biosynthesis